MNKHLELGVNQMDVLREISNIGMGNAVTSLSQLIGRQVKMTVPCAYFLPIEEIIQLVGNYEELVACISLRLLGEIPGIVFFLFNEASTYWLIDVLMGLEAGTTSALDEMAQSAVKEIGNVLAGSFISAICTMTGLKMVTAVPVFSFDMLGAVLTSLLVAAGEVEDQVLVIDAELFPQPENQIKGHFFVLMKPGSIERLMTAISSQVNN